MANMTFGVNLLPKNDGNTYSLGNSSQKWKIYLSEINDTTFNGLGQAAEKNVDTSISNASTSTNLPTSAAVAAFVEGKGYVTTDNNTTYTFANGVNGFTVTPSNGSAQTISVIPNMTILSYGNSTWQDFINAYNNNSIVYCKASSNSNPASGAQTRMAFMAYVNANPPTNVEFQYYRSVASHSTDTQGDQIYIYKLDSSGTWTVTVRNAYTKISVGTGIIQTYDNGELTLEINSQTLNSSNDLDLITEVGFYQWASTSCPLNTPVQNMAGRMVVYGKKINSNSTSVSGIAQLITSVNNNIYIRMGTSEGWNNFVRYISIDVNRVSTLEQKVLALEEESKPHIITDITDVSIEEGQTMSLTVEARNAETYTWEYRPTQNDAWRNPSSGYTSSTYSLKVAARHNGYQYRCKISNSIGYIYSGIAILTVT